MITDKDGKQWKLVPQIATPEMLENVAWREEYAPDQGDWGGMLAAAPAFEPSDDLVEEVARAICGYYDELPQRANYLQRKSTAREHADQKEAQDMARAAISAMIGRKG